MGVTSLNGIGRMLNAAQTALIPTTTATLAANYTPVKGYEFTPAMKDNFGPRLGVDYRVNDKLVLRAGGGMYYQPVQYNIYTLLTSNFPFAASVSYNTSDASPMTFTNNTPGAGTAPPVPGVAGTYLSAYTPQANMKDERAYQWNADLGYSLWQGAAFEAQYQGDKALHLDRNFYDNEPHNPVNPAGASINSQRPNQLFGSIRVFQEDEISTYHALTLVLRQRQFHGVSGQVGYTWSHNLDESPDANGGGTLSQQYNPRADYGNANWDIRNRIAVQLSYAMPKLATKDLVTREALGGWHLNVYANFQSGAVANVSMSSNSASAGVSQGTERPSWAHKPNHSCSLKNSYSGRVTSTYSCIDESSFQPAVNYTSSPTGPVGFGNLHRNSMRGPFFPGGNLGIFKDFEITELAKFQFRAEAYNVLNHPVGNPPNTGSIGIYNAGSTSNGVANCSTASACLNYTGTQFGQITGTVSQPRVLQLSGKLIF